MAFVPCQSSSKIFSKINYFGKCSWKILITEEERPPRRGWEKAESWGHFAPTCLSAKSSASPRLSQNGRSLNEESTLYERCLKGDLRYSGLNSFLSVPDKTPHWECKDGFSPGRDKCTAVLEVVFSKMCKYLLKNQYVRILRLMLSYKGLHSYVPKSLLNLGLW